MRVVVYCLRSKGRLNVGQPWLSFYSSASAMANISPLNTAMFLKVFSEMKIACAKNMYIHICTTHFQAF